MSIFYQTISEHFLLSDIVFFSTGTLNFKIKHNLLYNYSFPYLQAISSLQEYHVLYGLLF